MAGFHVPVKFEHNCYYQLESYHREKSSPQLESSTEVHHATKNVSSQCHTSVPRNSRSWRPKVNVSVPYNMLNCSCHECRRRKMLPAEQMKKPYERPMFHEEDACFPVACLGRLQNRQKLERTIYRVTPDPRLINSPQILRYFKENKSSKVSQNPWNSEYKDKISSLGKKIINEKLLETKSKVSKQRGS